MVTRTCSLDGCNNELTGKQRKWCSRECLQYNYNNNVREYDSERRRGYTLQAYGITAEEYDAMFEAQGERCAICRTDDPGAKNWHIDHCHESDEVRGILCANCNHMLGKAQDNIATLLAGANYLAGQVNTLKVAVS